MLHIHIRKMKASLLPYYVIQSNPLINLKKEYWIVAEFPYYGHSPRAHRKDKVQWHFFGRPGEKVYVQFPNTLIFEKANHAAVDGFVLSGNSHITLVVRKKAPFGRHAYAGFVTPANQFAIGGSPPVIIIERS